MMCQVYAMLGSLFGCTSIWTMTMIAFDRYNVIVKGLSAKPMTNGGAVLRILFIWIHAGVWTALPFLGWNRYVPEGNMTACGTDYLTKDWFSRSYILVYSVFVYTLPLLLIIYSYWFIVQVIDPIRIQIHTISALVAINFIEMLLYSIAGCICSREKHARTSQENECRLSPFV